MKSKLLTSKTKANEKNHRKDYGKSIGEILGYLAKLIRKNVEH